jgi:hypothetical protein
LWVTTVGSIKDAISETHLGDEKAFLVWNFTRKRMFWKIYKKGSDFWHCLLSDSPPPFLPQQSHQTFVSICSRVSTI